METVPLCDEDKAKILSGNVQRLLAVTTAWSRSFTRRVRSTASEPESFCADGAPWERRSSHLAARMARCCAQRSLAARQHARRLLGVACGSSWRSAPCRRTTKKVAVRKAARYPPRGLYLSLAKPARRLGGVW